MPELTDLSVIRNLCEKYDFALSKGFGQNFIINPGLPIKIVDASGVDKRYGVIEIGPGIGVLTKELAKRAAKVVSIEVDERLPPLLAETMAKCGDNLNVWSGNDDQIVPMMSLGAKGVISVLSNVAPQETHDLTQLCLENRYPEAAQMQFKYHSLIDALFCEVNPIPVKKAMELLGWKVGDLRLPLVEPSEEHIAYIKRELENAGCKI